jgi:hypothetical protein
MTRLPDPAAMSPADRQAELARILAAGFWRLAINQTELASPTQHEPSCASAVDGAQIPHEETPS